MLSHPGESVLLPDVCCTVLALFPFAFIIKRELMEAILSLRGGACNSMKLL